MNEKFFASARWIWENNAPGADEYADFSDRFSYDGGKVTLRLSCDSNYVLHINGKLVNFGQYPDYPFYKVVDEIDITPWCLLGENTIDVQVWYYGITFASTYFKGNAGLIYEAVCECGKVLAASGKGTRSRLSATYRQHYGKAITGQLGLSYYAVLNGQPAEWHDAVEVENAVTFARRPIDFLKLEERAPMTVLKNEGDHYLIDLGRETVGFLDLEFVSALPQKILVTFGEHIEKGGVHRNIGGRDFSVELDAGAGENACLSLFRRLGCRYLEIFCESPIEARYLGLRPVNYPLTFKPFDAGNELRQNIYDTCCRTLQLCMHDHYEDCPWREQALYALDSRNQMLCGYYTFGEYKFARASLLLMAKGVRPDKLIPICAPSSFDLPIASFSLIYPVQVCEYVEHSGDLSILDEVYPVVRGIIDRFAGEIIPETGLIPRLPWPVWNFYEWTPGSDNGGDLGRGPNAPYTVQYDLILNCMFLNTLAHFRRLAEIRGDRFDFDEDAMRAAIRAMFFDADKTIFHAVTDGDYCTRLGNALAVLTGVSTGEEAAAIGEKLKTNEGMVDISLSMNTFLYDALLKLDAGNRDFILADIDEKYGHMLSCGATSFWETLIGSRDFGEAGSLCHGWSALPAYYFHKLL